jgi:Cadherin-like beta sandwich domain
MKHLPATLALAAFLLVPACDQINDRVAFVGTSVSDASLSSLGISSGVLLPPFTPGDTIYTVAVGNDISTITVTPTSAASDATITVNGGPVASGTASPAIALFVGTTQINIRVLSPDGTNTVNYLISVARAF